MRGAGLIPCSQRYEVADPLHVCVCVCVCVCFTSALLCVRESVCERVCVRGRFVGGIREMRCHNIDFQNVHV